MRIEDLDQQLDAIGLLNEPLRRALYRHVASQSEEVSRDQAAKAVGISRILAAFHLDRLVDAGLLEAVYRRLSGRTGPGAGRTSKLYRRARRQFAVSLPDRRYELLARLLAEALKRVEQPTEVISAPTRELGNTMAREAAEGTSTRRDIMPRIFQKLEEYGFEPVRDGEWITLRNCPFHPVAAQYPGLVCELNYALMSGFAEALPSAAVKPQLQPQAGRCCVRLRMR
jgi:predicted ArsR family transcriptional regulator